MLKIKSRKILPLEERDQPANLIRKAKEALAAVEDQLLEISEELNVSNIESRALELEIKELLEQNQLLRAQLKETIDDTDTV